MQTESIEPVIGSEEKEKRSIIILKNLLCSTQLGSGNSAVYVMVMKAIEPGNTGSGIYSSRQGPTTHELRLHHGQRGRSLKLMPQEWSFTKFLILSSCLLPSPRIMLTISPTNAIFFGPQETCTIGGDI